MGINARLKLIPQLVYGVVVSKFKDMEQGNSTNKYIKGYSSEVRRCSKVQNEKNRRSKGKINKRV